MKKRTFFLLLAVLLLVVAGCTWYGTAEEAPPESPYVLYFQERDLGNAAGGGALRKSGARVMSGDGMSTRQLAEALMNDLLAGPGMEELKSTFPTGTTLLSVSVKGTQAIVDLSPAYGTLSGMALTLADQAVALTLTQLPDILSVRITVQGRELDYRDRQVFLAQDVLLAPEGDVVSTVEAALYFRGEYGHLAVEKRTLELYEGDTQVSAVIRAIENGPENKKLAAILPEGFRVKSAWQEEDVCYVNLSSGVLEALPEGTSLSAVTQALANSLCSLESVVETRFLVDGEFAEYYGSAYVGKPYMDWK